MDDLNSCQHLINCVGRMVRTERVLKNKETFIYLFTSSTCEGEKELLHKLKDIYHEIKKRQVPMEIFYISSDRDHDTMVQHFRAYHHGWYALPVGTETIRELQIQYNVTYEPQVIVVTKSGILVTKRGKAEIEEFGRNVIVKWMPPDF